MIAGAGHRACEVDAFHACSRLRYSGRPLSAAAACSLAHALGEAVRPTVQATRACAGRADLGVGACGALERPRSGRHRRRRRARRSSSPTSRRLLWSAPEGPSRLKICRVRARPSTVSQRSTSVLSIPRFSSVMDRYHRFLASWGPVAFRRSSPSRSRAPRLGPADSPAAGFLQISQLFRNSGILVRAVAEEKPLQIGTMPS